MFVKKSLERLKAHASSHPGLIIPARMQSYQFTRSLCYQRRPTMPPVSPAIVLQCPNFRVILNVLTSSVPAECASAPWQGLARVVCGRSRARCRAISTFFSSLGGCSPEARPCLRLGVRDFGRTRVKTRGVEGSYLIPSGSA